MSAASLALIASLLFALGVVLQQRGAMAAPSAASRGFLGSIFSNPVWLAGGGAQVVGWILQALALDRGSLFLVQPIISLQVVLALPLGIVFTSQRVHRREWLGAVGVVVGLALFLGLSSPSSGRTDAPATTWLLAGLFVAVIASALAVVGSRRQPAAKAALFGSAAGVLFGFQAGVTKAFTQVAHEGIGAILHSWTPYALALSAVLGFYFVQVSLQAGVLAPSVASMNVTNPATSIILGRVVFQEVPARSDAGKIVSLLAVAVIIIGLVVVSAGEPGARNHRHPSSRTRVPAPEGGDVED